MRCLYLNVPTSWDDWESQTEFAYFQTTFLPFQDVTYLYAYNQAVPPKRKYPHNVRFFPVRMDENRYRNAATVPWEILDALHDLSDRPVDFIVTHRPTIVPALRLWMESVCKVATPIVVVDSFVPHAQRAVQPPKKDAYYRLTAQGYALADACIAQCEYEYDLMIDTAYRYGMTDIRDKTFCLESKLVLPKNGGTESKTKSVLYGQKLTKAQRGGNEVLSTLQKLSYVRPDCQIYVTSQKRNTMKIVGKNVIEATNLSRAYYRELIKRVMVGFTMSKDEGFPKGLVEQILSDVVVFVPKAQWALQLFKDDYPFYYVNEDDLVKRMYLEGRKVIDPHMLTLLDEEALSIMFMADGSRYLDKRCNASPKYTINIKAYSYGDQWLLKKALKEKLGLEFNINRQNNYYYLVLRSKDVARFESLVENHILPSFKYKLGR